MNVLAFRTQGYAGFTSPSDVVFDATLSAEQKIETLRHWQRAVVRVARHARSGERDVYERLMIELSSAISRIEMQPGARRHARSLS